MIRKFLDKEKCEKFCNGTIHGEEIFKEQMQGQLDELVWGFLKKDMKIDPHRHTQKEVYIFLSGNGTMKVENEEFNVGKGDVIYIEPNALHTAWNDSDMDLEFVIVRVKKRVPNVLTSIFHK